MFNRWTSSFRIVILGHRSGIGLYIWISGISVHAVSNPESHKSLALSPILPGSRITIQHISIQLHFTLYYVLPDDTDIRLEASFPFFFSLRQMLKYVEAISATRRKIANFFFFYVLEIFKGRYDVTYTVVRRLFKVPTGKGTRRGELQY